MKSIQLLLLVILCGCQSHNDLDKANHLNSSSSSLPSEYDLIDLDKLPPFTDKTESLGTRKKTYMTMSGERATYKSALFIDKSIINSQPSFNLAKGVIPLDIKEASQIAIAAYKEKTGKKPAASSLDSVYIRPFTSNKSSYLFYFRFHKGHLSVLPDRKVIYESTK
ncbi:hypothetical protein [Shewanella atlantica]|uniref:hypothetical protein n=1 Tax=Shewanella atlantica TaxID=271099 RepID=UPI003734C19D